MRRLVGMTAAVLLAVVIQAPSPPEARAGDPCPAGQHCNFIYVEAMGMGAGTVTGNGMNCTVDAGIETGVCVVEFQYETDFLLVELTMTAAPFSTYVSTVGDTYQAGIPVEESVLLIPGPGSGVAKEVLFRLGVQELQLELKGAGSGRINHSEEGIYCPPHCTVQHRYGESGIIVIAVPDADSTFKSWDGICAGQDIGCQFDMPKSQTLTVTFGLKPTPGPTQRPSTPKPPATAGPTAQPPATAPPPAESPAMTDPSPAPAASPSIVPTASLPPPEVSLAPSGPPATPVASAASIAPTGTDAGFGPGLLAGILLAGVVLGVGGLVVWRRRTGAS